MSVTPPFILGALYITIVQYVHIYICLPQINFDLLALVLPVDQSLEHPNYNSGGREFDSHLELGIFSELSGVIILHDPNYTVFASKFCHLKSLFWLSLLVVEIVIS